MMLRIIGDVHGKKDDYLKLIEGVENSVQVGDLDFNYNWMSTVDKDKHKLIAGNHDNYSKLPEHSLGDYGIVELGGIKFFFVRGGYSIDKAHRTEGVNWWREEELPYLTCLDVLEAYRKEKPEIVISHVCPTSICEQFLEYGQRAIASKTGTLMDEMFQYHRPRLWIFGHYHMNKSVKILDTEFKCLNELQHLDLHPTSLP